MDRLCEHFNLRKVDVINLLDPDLVSSLPSPWNVMADFFFHLPKTHPKLGAP